MQNCARNVYIFVYVKLLKIAESYCDINVHNASDAEARVCIKSRATTWPHSNSILTQPGTPVELVRGRLYEPGLTSIVLYKYTTV